MSELPLFVVALVIGGTALVIYDARFAQLDEAMIPAGRMRILARAFAEAVTVGALTVHTPWCVVGLAFAGTSLVASLMAEITVGNRQERALSRAGVPPPTYGAPRLIMLTV
jgi:hypothetical protein